MQVLFLQGHSTCFGRKRPSSGVFKTSTAATVTCVIVAGKSSHLLIRAGTPAISQMKHQLDATLCRFYFCSGHSTCFGRKRPSSGVIKTSTAATDTCVIVAGKSSHLLIRAGTALIRRCDDLPATITHVPVAAVLVLITPDDGRLRPKYVE